MRQHFFWLLQLKDWLVEKFLVSTPIFLVKYFMRSTKSLFYRPWPNPQSIQPDFFLSIINRAEGQLGLSFIDFPFKIHQSREKKNGRCIDRSALIEDHWPQLSIIHNSRYLDKKEKEAGKHEKRVKGVREASGDVEGSICGRSVGDKSSGRRASEKRGSTRKISNGIKVSPEEIRDCVLANLRRMHQMIIRNF